MKSLIAVILTLLVISPLSVQANSLPSQAHIAVTGSAQLKVKPDIANFSFQVVALNEQAQVAKHTADQQVQNIVSQLEQAGFEEALLTRSDIQVRPEFQYIDKKRTQVGVRATRQLSYQLDDLDKVNLFLDTLVKANVANIGKINYALKKPKDWQIKVRNLAVKDSIDKAEGLAASYHAKRGKVYSINYQSNAVQPIMMRAMDSEKSTQSSYGNYEIVINERVSAVFLLDD